MPASPSEVDGACAVVVRSTLELCAAGMWPGGPRIDVVCAGLGVSGGVDFAVVGGHVFVVEVVVTSEGRTFHAKSGTCSDVAGGAGGAVGGSNGGEATGDNGCLTSAELVTCGLQPTPSW